MILLVGHARFRDRVSAFVRAGGFTPGGCDTLADAVELLPLTRPAGVVIDWPPPDAEADRTGIINLFCSLMAHECAPSLAVLVAEEGADVASANVARGNREDVAILRKPVEGPELVKLLKEGANNP